MSPALVMTHSIGTIYLRCERNTQPLNLKTDRHPTHCASMDIDGFRLNFYFSNYHSFTMTTETLGVSNTLKYRVIDI